VTAPAAPRTFLGRDNSWAERVRVYRTADAVEVVHVSALELSMRRVFLDEVRLVTLHRARASPATWLLALVAAAPALFAFLARNDRTAFEIFATLTVVLGALAATIVLVPTWTVSVYGKRARARMRYFGRPAKARGIYEDLVQRATTAQAGAAPDGVQSPPGPAAPPEPPGPPGQPAPPGPPAVQGGPEEWSADLGGEGGDQIAANGIPSEIR
jgi:hypothetical protein